MIDSLESRLLFVTVTNPNPPTYDPKRPWGVDLSVFGTAHALPAGRFAISDGDGVKYYRASGSTDRTRTYSATPRGYNRRDVCSDASDGSITFLEQTKDSASVDRVYVVRLSADGSTQYRRRINADLGSQDVYLAQSADGSAYVATVTTEWPSYASDDKPDQILITRVLAGGSIDSAYGTNGTATIDVPPIYFNDTYDKSFHADRSGRVYIVVGHNAQSVTVRRVSSGGTLDTRYGAPILSQGINGRAGDIAVMSDGTAVALVERYRGDGVSPNTYTAELNSLSPSGKARRATKLYKTFGAMAMGPVKSLTVAPDGSLWAGIQPEATTTRMYHLRDLSFVEGWGGADAAAVTASPISTLSVAPSASGVWVAGSRPKRDFTKTELFELTGDPDAPGVGPGRADLLADGTLAVRGTGGGDVVSLRTVGEDIILTLNGKTSTYVADDVRSVLVLALNGDDFVDASAIDRCTSIVGGAGNDNLVGGIYFDTLSGDEGNDRILGGGSPDQITGGDGNDTIFGGVGDDALFAAAGDDTLYGCSDLILSDGQVDVMFGERGKDTFAATSDIQWNFASDYDSDEDITI